jgi:antiviral helicase SKI2
MSKIVLFATETFAMGVNMPARAVVFNSIRKHDGSKFRTLEPGEYTQMAGRAGRRGLDKVGTVIMCCFGEEPPPQLILRNMLTGSSTRLSSQFRLTYNMILNLLRVEDMTVEGMIKRSFSEFATQRALSTNEYPRLLKRGAKALAKLEDEFVRDADIRIGAEDISEYYALSSRLLSSTSEGLTCLLSAVGNTAGGSLVPGRILLVTSARKKGLVRSPAIVVQAPQLASATKAVSSPAVCIALFPDSYNHVIDDSNPKPKEFHLNFIGTCKNRKFLYTHVDLDEILFISQIKHKIDPRTLYMEESSFRGGHVGGASRATNSFFNVKPVARQVDDFGFGNARPRGKEDISSSSSKTVEDQSIEKVVTLLIEAEAMEDACSLDVLPLKECSKGGVFQGDDAFRLGNLSNQICNYATELRTYKSHFHPSLLKHYITVEKKETLSTIVTALRHLLSNESLQLFPDFLQRKSLLKTLNYIDENDTVKVKGRVACECNTCEELIVTEMVFEGLLNELDPPEIVAALSALIFQEKTDVDLDPEIPERLRLTCEAMKKIALNLGQLQNEHGLMIDPIDYCKSSLKFGLVHVVYDWAMGVPFSNICQLTAVQEGSIVRCITRLDELCREVRNCARVVGNPTLYRKMEEASVAIKRDIVFASSLYVT